MLSLLCPLLGHKVDRHRVWHDRIDYRTSCMRCHRPLVRTPTGWREFDAERDVDPARHHHPNHGVNGNNGNTEDL